MDLYQIFITYNRPWTPREITCFSIIFLLSTMISLYLLHRRKIIPSQAIATLVILIFLAIVFGSTVFTRFPKSYHDYELELFWSWKEVFRGSREMLKENLLNMVLLFPVGLILPVMWNRWITWFRGLLAGVLISAAIEIAQLISCRGLFEWDDMIHNAIGCMVGCVISSWCGIIYTAAGRFRSGLQTHTKEGSGGGFCSCIRECFKLRNKR